MMKKIFTLLLLVGILFTAKNAIALSDGDPTDKLATPETKALYNQLKAASGEEIMFGQYYFPKISTWEDPYGTDSECYKITGKVPLILHVDYKADLWHTIDKMTNQIKAHYSKGGIIMVSWTMQNWDTGGSSWDVTGKPIVNILPGGSVRTKYLTALDNFANYLNNLKDANGKLIPVILRLFQENDGYWFWWGLGSGGAAVTTTTSTSTSTSTTTTTTTTSTTSEGKISYFSNDAGPGKVRVHYSAVSGKISSKVKIDNTWNYNGTYDVYNVTPTTFDIVHGFNTADWYKTGKSWTSSSPAAGTSTTSEGKISYFSNDAGPGKVRVHYSTVSGKISSKVKIDNTWNYNGTYDVYNVTPTTFDIVHGFNTADWYKTGKSWTSSWTLPTAATTTKLSGDTLYVTLWRDMVTYLRDKKGVHNLLYCYAPEIINGFAYDGPLYPGDGYVDILGLDNYANTMTTLTFNATPLSRFQILRDLSVAKNKPFGLVEGLRNEYPNKVVLNPNSNGIYPKYWTEQFINPILADSKAKYASFVIVFTSNPGSTANGWGPVKGYADEQSFRDISNNPKVKFLKY